MSHPDLSPPCSSHVLERVLEFEFVRATENAALNAIHWLGRGEKEKGDAAACDAIPPQPGANNAAGTEFGRDTERTAVTADEHHSSLPCRDSGALSSRREHGKAEVVGAVQIVESLPLGTAHTTEERVLVERPGERPELFDRQPEGSRLAVDIQPW
jgi:hypothetical protein